MRVIDVVASKLGPPVRMGHDAGRPWAKWPCPFHNGTKLNFVAYENFARCYGDCDCNFSAKGFLRKWGASEDEIRAVSGDDYTPPARPTHKPIEAPHTSTLNEEAWQEAALNVVLHGQQVLFGDVAGKRVLDYLIDVRQIPIEALVEYEIGYIPPKNGVLDSRVGLYGMRVPSGILIPNWNGIYWALKVRSHKGVQPKYQQVKGGSSAKCPYGMDDLSGKICLFVESELDAVLGNWYAPRDERGRLMTFLALGGKDNSKIHPDWVSHLLETFPTLHGQTPFLAVLDNDTHHEGDKMLVGLSKSFIVRGLYVPDGKDIGEFIQAHGPDALAEWLHVIYDDMQSCV